MLVFRCIGVLVYWCYRILVFLYDFFLYVGLNSKAMFSYRKKNWYLRMFYYRKNIS